VENPSILVPIIVMVAAVSLLDIAGRLESVLGINWMLRNHSAKLGCEDFWGYLTQILNEGTQRTTCLLLLDAFETIITLLIF